MSGVVYGERVMIARRFARLGPWLQFALASSAFSCIEEPGPDLELPDVEVRYNTKYVDVATLSDVPVCAGTLALMDAHVEDVLGLLDLELSRRLRVYHSNPGDSVLLYKDFCNPNSEVIAGCYSPDLDAIFTTNYSIPHEMTHALTIGDVNRRSHWEEPVAEAFSSKLPVPVFDPQWSDFDIANGYPLGHLARWIIEQYGGALFMELFVRTPKSGDQATLEAAVRDVLGVEFGDLISEYALTAPHVYPNHWLCYTAPTAVESPWSGDFWEHEVTLDCDQPDTFSDSDHRQARVTARVPLTIPRTGPYHFFADHPDAELLIQPCPSEPLMEPQSGVHDWPRQLHTSLNVGAPTLDAGSYVLFVNLPPGEPTTVRLIGYLAIR